MENKNTLSIIAEELGNVYRPLQFAFSSPESFSGFMLELGWDIFEIPQPIEDLVSSVNALVETLDGGDIQLTQFISQLKNLFDDIKNLKNQSASLFPNEVIIDDFQNIFPAQLIEFLLIEYLVNRKPSWGNFFKVIGLFEVEYQEDTGNRPGYIRRKINWNLFSEIWDNPFDFIQGIYNWGESDFKTNVFVEHLMDFASAFDLELRLDALEENISKHFTKDAINIDNFQSWEIKYVIFNDYISDVLTEAGIGLFILPETTNSKPGFAILPYVKGNASLSYELAENIFLNFESQFDFTGGVGIVVRPSESIKLITNIIPSVEGGEIPPSAGHMKITIENSSEDNSPIILLGSEDGSRLQYKAINFKGGVAVASGNNTDLSLELNLREAEILIKGGENDGFLNKLLPADGIKAEFDFSLGFSTIRGFYFRGSAGLEVFIPVHRSLGPIELLNISLGIHFKNGKIPISFAASVKAELGPILATVENLGLKVEFSFPEDGGNLGPLDLDLGFKPPNGVGLSIDAGAVKGAGYLRFLPEKGEYSGAAELVIIEIVAVKAIGIITTKNPDGTRGFSFLLLVTAEFTPIQLGFGFTLNGVGGLVAINRGMNINALAQGVKTNAIDQIMFPDDPVANAPSIIASLNSFFPIEQRQYTFGFLGAIGWGTPTLIRVELGFILQVPDPVRIAILGVVKMKIPDEKAPLIRLQVNFLGAFDFGEKYMFFLASLYDSGMLWMTMSGDLYFMLDWGDNPNFVYSVGGFHPDYKSPALRGIDKLERITVNLFGPNPRLTLRHYFAVTSNTVQFGASIDFLFKVWKFRVIGYIYFDALFQFNPFYFKITIGAGLSVMWGSTEFMGIHLKGSLEGPTPWRVSGYAKIKVCWLFSVKVKIDKTFGDPKDTSLPPVEVLPDLIAALENSSNWQAELPSSGSLDVSIRQLELGPDEIIAHPFGRISVCENKVPLEMKFNKYGANQPSDYQKFKLSLGIGDVEDDFTGVQKVEDFFAPAQYIKMSDNEKLSKKSFEKYQCGLRAIGMDGFDSHDYVERVYEHEICIIDDPDESPNESRYMLEDLTHFDCFVKGNSVAKSIMGREFTKREGIRPPEERIVTVEEEFILVNANDLTPITNGGEQLRYGTQTEANSIVELLCQEMPELDGQIQVVPVHEMETV